MMRVFLLLALCGCDSGGMSAAPPDLAPPRITTAATDGTVTLMNADFSIDGSGLGVIGAFSLQHGSGTIELDGRTVPAAVYERQMFAAQNLNLYQTLAVESDRIWVLWFYCSSVDNSLQGIYYEATDGTSLHFENGVGTCQDTNMTSTVAVQFPPLDMMLPPLIDGYKMDGASVKLDGAQPGTVTLGGTTLAVFVFNIVDCREGCGTPGWTELHSLLWDSAAARLCFGIFYLMLDAPDRVQLAYSLTLPSLIDPAGDLFLPATWMTP